MVPNMLDLILAPSCIVLLLKLDIFFQWCRQLFQDTILFPSIQWVKLPTCSLLPMTVIFNCISMGRILQQRLPYHAMLHKIPNKTFTLIPI